MKNKYTYISLFSSAGVGCYGFKQAGFECVATNEILEKRLNIQKYNKKCKYDSGYISGDILLPENKQKIFTEVSRWKSKEKIKEVDVLIATPPCQGMSVANHKKKNEQTRNSLIVESIKLVVEINPRYFIFENVRSLLNTSCTNIDGNDMTINKAIELNLSGQYNILKRVVNFKDVGSSSSRTRTIVIGVRKDIKDITPFDIFPKEVKSKTLKQVIGKYSNLKDMGEIDSCDIYHHFRRYDVRMLEWIKDIKEGQSAFENNDLTKIPHKIIDGEIVYNKNKNGDKYKRCEWNKVAPCIHTRNDILASQATVHPVDNRVFSIRELMDMMTIPKSFKWVADSEENLNSLTAEEKEAFLKKEAMNIRQSIGEAVPTAIFNKIANNIIKIEQSTLSNKEIKQLIDNENLHGNYSNLYSFISNHKNIYPYNTLSKIIEFSNTNRDSHAAFYTPQSVCYSLIKELPDFKKHTIRILEPSVGAGNFVHLLLNRYHNKNIVLDVVDLDSNILELLKLLQKDNKLKNVSINYIHGDFLTCINNSKNKYDLIIGNPPFGKVKDKLLLKTYRSEIYNSKTSNIFSFFLEKAINISTYVAMITPKSLLAAPEFNMTREFIENNSTIKTIIDYGEKGFDGVKIETISTLLHNKKTLSCYDIIIESYITKNVKNVSSECIFDKDFNSWLIYANAFFKDVKHTMYFSIYNFHRDRVITKKHTAPKGLVKVLKSRNIQDNHVVEIENYDCFISNIDEFNVSKYLNSKSILIPNLSYNPRACFMPKNSVADGSVAILQPKNGFAITGKDLAYYASKEFKEFYMIGRNLGTRSLNIDSNSINLWGIKKESHVHEHK